MTEMVCLKKIGMKASTNTAGQSNAKPDRRDFHFHPGDRAVFSTDPVCLVEYGAG